MPAPDSRPRPERLTDWWIVVVAYNRYDLVNEATDAYRQQVPTPGHVLVVDNTDMPDMKALTDLGVPWIPGHDEQGHNSGSAGGFARGMDYAFERGAAYVVLSDQDFVPEPDLLASLWETTLRHPAAAVSSFTVDPATGETAPAWLAAAPDQRPGELCLAPNRHEMAQSLGWTIGERRFASLPEVRAYAATTNAEVGRVPLAFPQGLAISREIHDAIGGFRREFFVGWEDYDYCCRLQDAGYPLLLALGAAGHHHLSWHRTIRLGPVLIKPFDNTPQRFYFYLRNSIVMARERARGCLFAKWVARLAYYSATYVAFGPASPSHRVAATGRAWRSGLAHSPEGRPRERRERREPEGGR